MCSSFAGQHRGLCCLPWSECWLSCAHFIPVSPYLFPLGTAICAGHIIVLVFIRNMNSKYKEGTQLITPEYSQDVLFGKWLQIAVLTSTPGPFLLGKNLSELIQFLNNCFQTYCKSQSLQDTGCVRVVCWCTELCCDWVEKRVLYWLK